MKKQLLIAALAALQSPTILADGFFGTSESSSESGFYGGGGIGQTSLECDGCNTTNWKLFGGYKVSKNVSIEGGYYNIIDAKKEIAPGADADVAVTGLGLAGIASFPVSDDVEIFGKVGVMKWDIEAKVTGVPTSINSDGTDLLVGAGGMYKMDENWGVRGEYERIGGDIKANMYSVGAVFSTL
ncbi:porin family protein [Candidatus Thiothrix anitrata]|uniref:Porin family protein n=1 Tax=Candidatus Thiothrix anitrata TaxID=2823902 RepID=A0ABX7X3G9_9GAMM|nr:porin family protein [Candidatus Thiothrix anitrata]QTR49223.1 porin family protein [Candidatus Thiothrix anitrata]